MSLEHNDHLNAKLQISDEEPFCDMNSGRKNSSLPEETRRVE